MNQTFCPLRQPGNPYVLVESAVKSLWLHEPAPTYIKCLPRVQKVPRVQQMRPVGTERKLMTADWE